MIALDCTQIRLKVIALDCTQIRLKVIALDCTQIRLKVIALGCTQIRLGWFVAFDGLRLQGGVQYLIALDCT